MARIVDPEGREAELLRRLIAFDGKEVIDLGCGDGRTMRAIAQTAASVLGVDPDRDAIALAVRSTSEGGTCSYMAGDLVSLDLPPTSFDVAIFTRSL